jgi:hypothetical protein
MLKMREVTTKSVGVIFPLPNGQTGGVCKGSAAVERLQRGLGLRSNCGALYCKSTNLKGSGRLNACELILVTKSREKVREQTEIESCCTVHCRNFKR